MIDVLDAAKMAGGALLGATAVIAYTQFVSLPAARSEGRALERADTLKKAIDLVQERSRTNADVRNLDDGAICVELGGVWLDGGCH